MGFSIQPHNGSAYPSAGSLLSLAESAAVLEHHFEICCFGHLLFLSKVISIMFLLNRHLYNLCQMFPESASDAIRFVLRDAMHEMEEMIETKGRAAFPGLDVVSRDGVHQISLHPPETKFILSHRMVGIACHAPIWEVHRPIGVQPVSPWVPYFPWMRLSAFVDDSVMLKCDSLNTPARPSRMIWENCNKIWEDCIYGLHSFL